MVLSVMIITCPSCATRYSLDDSKIPEDGRQVRCVQCSHVWHQEQSEPEDLLSLDEVEADVSESEVPQLEDVSAEPPPEDEIDDIEADDESDELEIGEPDQDVDEPEDVDAAAEGPADEDAPVEGAGSSAWRSVRERVVEPSVAEEHTSRSDTVGWAILGVLVLSVVAAIVFFRSELEEVWPPSQRLYATVDGWLGEKASADKSAATEAPTPSTAYQNVSIKINSSRIAMVNGERVLMIEGLVTNSGDTVSTVPNLRGSLKGSKGETLYSWDFSVPFMTIAARTEQEFETRVVDPPAGATIINLDPVTQN